MRRGLEQPKQERNNTIELNRVGFLLVVVGLFLCGLALGYLFAINTDQACAPLFNAVN